MKRPTDAEAYMSKAQRTLKSARSMLREKDSEGACNRAYYAMFYAAHAALLSLPAAPAAEYKTHRGLIGAFGKHVVTGAKMDPALGRSISAVQQLRQISDYLGDPPDMDKVTAAVEAAGAFVKAIEAALPQLGGAE